jgi:hypothetical protein
VREVSVNLYGRDRHQPYPRVFYLLADEAGKIGLDLIRDAGSSGEV